MNHLIIIITLHSYHYYMAAVIKLNKHILYVLSSSFCCCCNSMMASASHTNTTRKQLHYGDSIGFRWEKQITLFGCGAAATVLPFSVHLLPQRLTESYYPSMHSPHPCTYNRSQCQQMEWQADTGNWVAAIKIKSYHNRNHNNNNNNGSQCSLFTK